VVIPLAAQHYKLMQRNLFYTGITRGKRLLVLIGQKKAAGHCGSQRSAAAEVLWAAVQRCGSLGLFKRKAETAEVRLLFVTLPHIN
jgi:hypothetical protein